MKKVDHNHKSIVEGLRAVGQTILSTAPLGKGAPDVLAGGLMPCPHCGVKFPQNALLEIKNENQPPSKRRLTDKEKEFHESWRGQVATVENLDQALKIVLGS